MPRQSYSQSWNNSANTRNAGSPTGLDGGLDGPPVTVVRLCPTVLDLGVASLTALQYRYTQ
jgi:hypothetical protein